VKLYRDQEGRLCEVARFNGGHIRSDEGLDIDTGSDDWAWIVDAMNDGTVEISAFGSSLILNFRGGSYGVAPGDWLIRRRGGEIVPCRGDRFEQQYEPVHG
jgi:hypothetical protein